MNLPFTLEQLRIFKAIASKGNFTKAAENLCISQPYLSRKLKTLESRLGNLLIRCDKNQVELTESGKIFLTYSERILGLCEESCRALKDLQTGERGKVKIGNTYTVFTYLLPPLLTSFRNKYKQICFSNWIGPTRSLIHKILAREIDIAIVNGDLPQDLIKKVNLIRFIDDEFLLIIPNTDPPFLSQERIDLETLYSLNFITFPSGSGAQIFINKILTASKIDIDRLNIIMEVNEIETIQYHVASSSGVAFVPASMFVPNLMSEYLDIVDIRHLKINPTISIIMNSSFPNSKTLEIFCEELMGMKHDILVDITETADYLIDDIETADYLTGQL